ncbi:MAG: glucosyltransferase domain-containing protein [Eubacteriales bacterium]|nr:glucosyltransferase domain-containing protein [Eubacteriales bacterium]
MKNRKELLAKILFSISGTIFFALVASARESALIGCIILGFLTFLFITKVPFTEMRRWLKNPMYCMSGFAVSIIFGNHFLATWIFSDKLQPLAKLTGINDRWLLMACTVIFTTLSIPFTATIAAYFTNIEFQDAAGLKVRNLLRKASCPDKSAKKVFAAILLLYALGICAILRADYNYIDDMGRIARGYRGWENFSRILSNILSVFLHAGTYLTDISPLPQLTAIIILALSGVMLLYIIYDRNQFSVWELIALVPLGLNPYFLGCLSYKYDAPYMALSVLGSILPLYFRRKKTYIYVFASALGSLIVCTTYQAATGIFPMIVIALALRMWSQKDKIKTVAEFCIRSLIGYGIGMILFRTIIMVPVDDYVSSALPDWKNLIPCFFKNLMEYFNLVRKDFKTVWLLLIFVLIIGYIWTTVQESKQKKYLSFIMASLSVILMLLLCFGIYPMLETPLFQPRAMYGFGVFVSVMGIIAVEKRACIPFKLPVLVLSWMFFVFAFTYGNSLNVQKEYADFRMKAVIEDLDDMEAFLLGEPVTVQISGTIGQSPVLRNMPQNFEMLNRLVPIAFQGGQYWGTYEFYYYYDLANVLKDDAVDLTAYDLPVLKDTMYHTIKGKGQHILVELK